MLLVHCATLPHSPGDCTVRTLNEITKLDEQGSRRRQVDCRDTPRVKVWLLNNFLKVCRVQTADREAAVGPLAALERGTPPLSAGPGQVRPSA